MCVCGLPGEYEAVFIVLIFISLMKWCCASLYMLIVHVHILFREIQILWPFFRLGYLSLYYWAVMSSLCTTNKSPLPDVWFSKMSPFPWVLFTFLMGSSKEQKMMILVMSSLFSLLLLCIQCHISETTAYSRVTKIYAIAFSKSLIVLAVIYIFDKFEFIFIYHVRSEPNCILLHVDIHLSWVHLLKIPSSSD